MKRRTCFAVSGLALAIGTCWVSPALAVPADPAGSAAPRQNAGDPPATNLDVQHGGGLGEIVVTAQRRSENLQKAAIAVTAVTADSLVRAGVSDATQLSRVAPALQIGNIAGAANAFYLRGVGNFTTNSLSDSAVSFNVDGVAFARSQAAQAVFYDLDRVEVLKGPQGTLYGRNATGGAINVITAKPRLGELSGYGTFEYGNYDAKKLTAALNVPLGEEGAIRVAGYLSKHDGYFSDGLGDDDTRAIRVQVASRLTDTFKLTVGADYAFQGGKGSGATIAGLGNDKRIGVLDPRSAAVFRSTYAFLAGNFLHPLEGHPFNHNKFWGMYAQADVDTPVGTLTILPAYRYAKILQTAYNYFSYNTRLADEQVSVEMRLASSGANRLNYILGLYYMDEMAKEDPAYVQQYFSTWANFSTRTKSYAAFGRLTFNVTDRLRLNGGIRYTIDDKSANLNALNAIVICPSSVAAGRPCPGTPALPETFNAPSFLFAANGAVIPVQPYGPGGAILQTSRVPTVASQTFRKPTYRGGIEYDLGPSSLLYASVETGFKSGGFFSSDVNPVYFPETITAWTIGSKNRFLGNNLQINVEAFYWTYKDQQVSHQRTNARGATEFATENVGKTRVQGFEIEARARAGEGTILSATVQYLDARYRDFVYTSPASQGAPATGCPVTGPAGGLFTVNCSGRRPAQAPVWTLSGGIEQTFRVDGIGEIVFNADGRYQTESWIGFDQLPGMLQGGYFTGDLQLSYTPPRSGLTIAGFANNVTNANVAGNATKHGRAPSLVVLALRPPRTYGVRVGYKF